jgi:hypothetical protein
MLKANNGGKTMSRLLMALALLVLVSAPTFGEGQQKITMYKRPYCGCCDGHADHLRANGFEVTVIQTEDLSRIKKKYGVPQELEGCHTIIVDGYAIEGHVPATIIRKLLKERPAIRGISLPGMPAGSPGMGGTKNGPFVIHEFSTITGGVFATD